MEVAGTSSDHTSPLETVQRDSLKQSVAQAITQLSEREQMVLALYYDEELNLKEIGEILGVSESRVSQIHSQAALRLRNRLTDWQSHNGRSGRLRVALRPVFGHFFMLESL